MYSLNPYALYYQPRNFQLPDWLMPQAGLNYSWGGGQAQSPATTTYNTGNGNGALNTGMNIASAGKSGYELGTGRSLATDIHDAMFSGGAAGAGAGAAAGTPGVGAGSALAVESGAVDLGAGSALATEAGAGGFGAEAGAGALGAEAAGAAALSPLMYGLGGMGLMLAMMQLGGAFDPDTAKLGIAGTAPLSNGKLGAPDILDQSNYGAEAPDSYYGDAVQFYQAMDDYLAGTKLDPSWNIPGDQYRTNGLTFGVGADSDVGLGNPTYWASFDTGRFQGGDTGAQGGNGDPWAGQPINLGYSGSSLQELIDAILKANPYGNPAPRTWWDVPGNGNFRNPDAA